MSLLQVLNLPIPKNLSLTQAALGSNRPGAEGMAGSDRHPVAASQGLAPLASGASAETDDVRAEATQLRAALEVKRKLAADALLKLQRLEPELRRMTDAATGEQKRQLLAKQGVLKKKSAEAEHEIREAEADLEMIENPGSKRDELVSMLARRRSGGEVAESVDVSSAGFDPYKASVNRARNTTSSDYANGKATVETMHDKRDVDITGFTTERSTEKEMRTADLAQRTVDEKKTHLSVTGKASSETTRSVEIALADGSKSKLERKDASEITAKGASHEHTDSKTNFDGSSTSTTRKSEVERGEGKITVTQSSSTTVVNAAGTSRTTDHAASGGLDAGKDGYGVHAGIDAGKSVTGKNGLQAGLVGNVHANVKCNIGEPVGDPKMYPVTLTVSFGASLTASTGAGKKEGSKASVDVEIKGGVDKDMVRVYTMNEAELGGYVKSLQDASKKGGKVAATHEEFGIIAAGVNKSWDAARQMFRSRGGAITANTADSVKRTGDSVEITDTKTGSVGLNVKAGPLSIGGSVSVTDEASKKATRVDPHTLDVDSKSRHTKERSRSLGMSAGVFDLKVGTVTTHSTSFGYAIEIDDKNDADHKILAALGRCSTDKDYQAFLARHKGKVKLVSHTAGKRDGKSGETGVGVMGVDLKFGTGQSTSEEKTTDGQGKLVKKTVIGEETAGGSFLGMKDSRTDQAKAVIDGKGNVDLTLTTTTTANDDSVAIEKRAHKLAGKILGVGDGKKAGALASAAGGGDDDDSTSHHIEGLTLSTGDLKKLGGVACRSLGAWNGATRHWREKEDWAKAGVAIQRAKGAPAVVAEELARFIGGDRVDRKQTVELWIRGGYHATTGHAFEFPDSLYELQADYNEVVSDALPAKMDTLAKERGHPAAADECKRLAATAARIEPRIRKCDDFENKATKEEMLSRLIKRQAELVAAIKGFSGDEHADVDPKVLEDKCDRLTKLCQGHYHEQNLMSQELEEADIRSSSDRQEVRGMIKKLEDMQFRWWNDYYELRDTYALRNVPMPTMAALVPSEQIVAFYEKKIGDA